MELDIQKAENGGYKMEERAQRKKDFKDAQSVEEDLYTRKKRIY